MITIARAVAITAILASSAVADSARRAAPKDDLNYVLLVDDSTSMSGDTRDLKRVRAMRHGNERLLWVRLAGKEYVIRDAATIQQAVAAWKPVSDLGEQQGALGQRQGALGARQGELGARQGALGARTGSLASREASIDMRIDSASPDEAKQLKAERKDIRRQLRQIERDMHALEQPMQELGEQMDVLGHQMEALGNKMEAASRKGTADMAALVDRAIASGIAGPI